MRTTKLYFKLMLRKFLLGIVLFLFIFFEFYINTYADENFIIDSKVTYSIQESGITLVSNEIQLENLVSEIYATSYYLELNNIKPLNVKAYHNTHQFDSDVKQEENKTTITVNFDDAMVGKGKIRDFIVSYEVDGLAVRTGEIWEISIPRTLEDANYKNYTLQLNVPTSLGEEAYMSPIPLSTSTIDGNRIYTYDDKDLLNLGISAGFGNFQVFSFTLNYHLENPLNKIAQAEIAIPPDTAYQKMFYEVVSPKPKNVILDSDGNWLASYELNPKQRLDVVVGGSVQIFSGPRPFLKYPEEVLQNNLKGTKFWQVDDVNIKTLATRLKNPYDIYDFVSKNLTYDFDRVSPNTTRLGAKAALENPESAICTEYTDAFIAIARAAGIPSREIDGFAYTENPDIQPLSLVSDVLHAWPEYWDAQRGVWVPIDPTWASTTGGVDYFKKLDLRHFTFVIHGQDDNYPFPPGSYKLGPSPQKDVFVNFGQLPAKKISIPEIIVSFKNNFGILNKKIAVEVDNPGPVGLYNTKAVVLFDENAAQTKEFDILPPFSNTRFYVYMPLGIFGNRAPEKVTLTFGDQTISLPTNKNLIIITNLAIFLIILLCVLVFVILRLKKISILSKIASLVTTFKYFLYAKFKKNKDNSQGL